MICKNCGAEIPNDSVFCPKCGFNQNQYNGQNQYIGNNSNGYAKNQYNNQVQDFRKSRTLAAVLQILLGCCGAGRFYLGYTTIGIIQVVVFWVGALILCGIPSIGIVIWTIVDGILILTGNPERDANGNTLKD